VPSPRLALSACLLLGAGLACNSDDLYFDEAASTSTTGTTGTPTTDAGSTSTGDATTGTTGADDSSSGDETTEVPPEQTCRDVLMCVGECALTLDLACFQMCAEGLPPDEAAKAVQLGLCVGGSCFESGACSPDTLMEPKCLGCIFIGILSPNPPGCEDQAAACE
jgi:hypothetical protein